MPFFSNLTLLLTSLLSASYAGFNVLDLFILGIIVFYLYEGYRLGLVLAGLDFISFILSFVFALVMFSQFGSLITGFFSIPLGFANAIAFFLVAFASEILLTFLMKEVLGYLTKFFRNSRIIRSFSPLSHPLGVIPGLASSYIVLSFVLTLIIALPASPRLKDLVVSSKLGGGLVSHTVSIQQSLQGIFGNTFSDTLNVMTIKPESQEMVHLNFTVPDAKVDQSAEMEMFELVNKERIRRGLPVLKVDSRLLILARKYASTMFRLGYFSHYTLDNKSPFDRMNEAGISYAHAGENLALAPNTKLAHQGLMNSPGHRANILSLNYRKVGIGVVDGGVYGKMYVQEFTD